MGNNRIYWDRMGHSMDIYVPFDPHKGIDDGTADPIISPGCIVSGHGDMSANHEDSLNVDFSHSLDKGDRGVHVLNF